MPRIRIRVRHARVTAERNKFEAIYFRNLSILDVSFPLDRFELSSTIGLGPRP